MNFARVCCRSLLPASGAHGAVQVTTEDVAPASLWQIGVVDVGGAMANAGPASLHPVVKPGDTIFLRRVSFSVECDVACEVITLVACWTSGRTMETFWELGPKNFAVTELSFHFATGDRV